MARQSFNSSCDAILPDSRELGNSAVWRQRQARANSCPTNQDVGLSTARRYEPKTFDLRGELN